MRDVLKPQKKPTKCHVVNVSKHKTSLYMFLLLYLFAFLPVFLFPTILGKEIAEVPI